MKINKISVKAVFINLIRIKLEFTLKILEIIKVVQKTYQSYHDLMNVF
jgi:hypothetical protein